MTNASAIPVTQQSTLDLGNPMIAVTAILVIGMCYCVTVYAMQNITGIQTCLMENSI